jgi:hypothetical protein
MFIEREEFRQMPRLKAEGRSYHLYTDRHNLWTRLVPTYTDRLALTGISIMLMSICARQYVLIQSSATPIWQPCTCAAADKNSTQSYDVSGQLHALSPLPQVKQPRYPLDSWLGRPQSRCARYAKQNNITINLPVYSLVTIMTQLYEILHDYGVWNCQLISAICWNVPWRFRERRDTCGLPCAT